MRLHFGNLVFRTSVPRSVRLAEAPSYGLPANLPTTVAPPEPTPTGRWRWSLSSAPESSPRRGLGRGLEVLIGGNPVPSELLEIPVDAIHPNPKQPRRRFEAEAASGLADSVRRQGVIQPLLVRPRGIGGYESSPVSAAGARLARPAARQCRRSSARSTTARRSCSAWSRTSRARR